MPHASPGIPALLGTAGLAATLLLASCGTSGRELAEPPATVTPVATVAVVPNLADGPGGMAIRGVAFEPGEVVDPALVGTDGRAPDLVWRNVPAGTAEVVLVALHADAPPDERIVWAVAGLAATTAGIVDGSPPTGARLIPRSDGDTAWSGVSTTGHRVQFLLCALATPTPPDVDAEGIRQRCDRDPVGVASVAVIVGGS